MGGVAGKMSAALLDIVIPVIMQVLNRCAINNVKFDLGKLEWKEIS